MGIAFVGRFNSDIDSLPSVSAHDRMLTHGSLVLYDPAHSTDPMAPGVVASQRVPNIAWREAAALLGSGDSASLSGAIGLGSGNSAPSVLVERSSRGGIHVVMSQVNQTLNTQGVNITLASALRDYFAANPNHNYYISRWVKKTRESLTGGPSEGCLYTNGSGATSGHLYNIVPLGMGGDKSSYESTPGPNNIGEMFQDMRSDSWFGTDPGTLSALGHPVAWGLMIGSYQSAAFHNKSASYILRRFYIEDLTVSGRSYSEVNALNKDFWTADLALGGRYYGDTYTDPATLP